MIESATRDIANSYRKELRRARVLRWVARVFYLCLAVLIVWVAL